MILPAYRTLTEPIMERAQRDPEWVGLVLLREDSTRDLITALQLRADVIAYAGALRAAGIGRDDVVILAMGHCRELIGAFLGAMHLGAIPSIFPTYVTARLEAGHLARRIEAHVESAAARAVITFPQYVDPISSSLSQLGCRVLSSADLAAGLRGEAAFPTVPVVDGDKLAFLQYTSGTGGHAKGIAHSHRKVLGFIANTEAPPADGVIVNWLPLYHDFGLVSGLLMPLVLGIRAVLISPLQWIRDPRILFRAIHEFRGTWSFMANFALDHCARSIRERDLEGLDLSCWTSLWNGGEPVRVESERLFVERFAPYGFRESALRAGYGMSELVEAATFTPQGRPPNVDWILRSALQQEQRAEPAPPQAPDSEPVVSCGVPLAGVEVRIVDEHGLPLPERRVGEIIVRSAYMLDGYYRRPDLTAQAIRDGWFFTGDVGYLAAGELYVTGRKKDLIIVGGKNVHPEDLEALAETIEGIHPGRSVAFGVHDARLGSERVVVVCELTQPCAAEQKLAIERRLRRQVVQEFDVTVGDLRLVDKGWVIKTSSGKKARPQNREKYLSEFGTGGQ